MLRRFGARLAEVIAVIVLVSFFATALTALIPGSPAAYILGDNATTSAIATLNAQLGLDHPLLTRYWDWVTHALHGNLGVGFESRQPVTTVLAQHVPITAELALLAIVLAVVIAIPTALLSAARAGKTVDRIATAVTSTMLGLPVYVSSVLIVLFLAVKAGLFPSNGWSPLSQGLGQNLRFAALPTLTLTFSIAPLFVRILRADLVSLLGEEFVLAARVRGIPEWYILVRHVLRPAIPSLLTLIGIVFGYLLGGSIVVETFYSVPGMGYLAAQAVSSKDIPVVQGIVVCVAVVYLVLNTLIDALYAIIDPRVREAA